MKRDLWAECPPCSRDSPYTGRAEVDRGRLYGLFACPQCHADFAVWRPAFDELLAEDAVDAAGLLHDLASRLCRVPPGGKVAMETALGDSGAAAALEAEVTIHASPRPCATVDLHLPRWAPQFDHLEERFGPPETMPRTGPDALHFYAWKVRVPGSPSDVSVFARFRHKPQPYSRPTGVLMRLDPRA
ncbi:MAG TPA: hypothetical protein VF702_08215 [Allosphingosinicella sp.]